MGEGVDGPIRTDARSTEDPDPTQRTHGENVARPGGPPRLIEPIVWTGN
jgi:hypothetical protein